jgi:hypothetical protein
VLAARGDRTELAQLLRTFGDETGLAEEEQVTLAILGAVAAQDPAAASNAFASIECVFAQMRLELGVLAVRLGALDAEQRARLVELARADSLWAARAGEL